MPRRRTTDSQLTARQRQILEIIRTSVSLRGYPPTIREIGDAVGLSSTSSVAYQLDVLEKRGHLRRASRASRAYDIRGYEQNQSKINTNPEDAASIDLSTSYVPIVGTIAAGEPITAKENIEEYLPLPRRLIGDEDVFALLVAGDSMINAGIHDGDWVIVHSQSTAENKEIVAALIDGEATVKYLEKKNNSIRLLPANPSYSPIEDPNITILGKVISVFRSYQ